MTKIKVLSIFINLFVIYDLNTKIAQCNNRPKYHLLGSTDQLSRTSGQNQQPQQVITSTQQPPPIPEFEAPIGNQTIALGRDAQLTCRIRDLGNFRTAWLRVEDKGILTIHNNIITRNYRIGLVNDDVGKEFVLTIKNVQPSDSGGYMCQINSVPMKYAVGYLDVLTPPSFEVDGEADDAGNQQATTGVITVTEGSNATLSCKASGRPQPEINWRREDGQPIVLDSSSSSEEIKQVEGSTLILASVNKLNAGAYLCIASNGVQPAASKRQLLDVHFGPIIRLPLTEVSGRLNDPEVSLSCHIELNPTGTYHWVREAATGGVSQRQASDQMSYGTSDDLSLIATDELTSGDKYEIVMNQMGRDKIHSKLIIRQLEKADFGTYRCIARNSLGIQSSSVRLIESSTPSGGSFGRSQGKSSDLDDRLAIQQQRNGVDLGEGVNGKPVRQHSPMLSRAQTRSSWIQRFGSSSGARQQQDGNSQSSPEASSSAGLESIQRPKTKLMLVSLLCSWLLLM